MSGTILCVDDDRNLCQILAKALRGEGYRVQTAFDGEEALAALEKETPDLILLDVILPRRDGFAVLETIRTFDDPLGSIPVVLMSACTWSHPGFAERARSMGAAALLEKPVPLAEVLAVVREHAGEAKRRESPRGSGKRGARRPPPALSGSLERLPFPSLLHHLHGLRASGVLHLTTGRKRKWLQLRDGYPVAVRSNLVNECLGNMLMRSGRVGREHVEESRKGMRAGRLQGEILVAMEVLSEEEMTAALLAQAEQKLFEIFSWKAGSFRFELGARVQRANSLAVKSSPANLILHGVRKRFPAERIDAYLKEHKDLFLVAGESPFYRFQEIDLEPAHEQLLRDLDGTQRLANLTGRDDTLDRTLYALLMTGLLELQSAPQGGQVATPRHVEREEASRAPQEARAELAELAERFSSQSPHEVLGIERGADEQAIREAYERLSARTHPDRFSDAGEAVKRLAEEVYGHVARAHETLVDKHRRVADIDRHSRERREARERQERDKRRLALEAEQEFQRGCAQLERRAYETALRQFGRALELYPEDGEYHAHYGWALHLCHPDSPLIIEEALEHVKRGISLATDREKPYLFMGRLCKTLGRNRSAAKMFTRAVQVRPDCVEALRELRLIKMRGRRKSKGLVKRLFGR